jgi:hypothetical protein
MATNAQFTYHHLEKVCPYVPLILAGISGFVVLSFCASALSPADAVGAIHGLAVATDSDFIRSRPSDLQPSQPYPRETVQWTRGSVICSAFKKKKVLEFHAVRYSKSVARGQVLAAQFGGMFVSVDCSFVRQEKTCLYPDCIHLEPDSFFCFATAQFRRRHCHL